MTSLNICLMGGVSIEKEGRQLEKKMSEKALAMICLLLSADKQQMAKYKVASFLWPESGEEAAKYNLRYNVWHIKKIIPVDSKGESFLHSDKKSIGINPAYDYRADILVLKAYDENKTHNEEDLLCCRRMFAGEYLEGLYLKDCMTYADWMLMERIAYQNLQISVLKKLLTLYEQKGLWAQCISTLQELLTIDPYNEQFAQAMMTAFCQSRQETKALAFYKSFAQTLRNELNVSPAEELQTLHVQIQNKSRLPDRKKSRQIHTTCLAGVDYFWITDCLKSIFEALDPLTFDQLDRFILNDLAFLYPALLSAAPKQTLSLSVLAARPVPEIRILHSFYAFLREAAKREPLDIQIEAASELDLPSRHFLALLQRRPIAGIYVSGDPQYSHSPT